jgi:hypothetical protein
MLAITRSRPPQRRQVSMSIQASEATPKQANTRLRRCAVCPTARAIDPARAKPPETAHPNG